MMMKKMLNRVWDDNLRLTLEFGIGMHHAGLIKSVYF